MSDRKCPSGKSWSQSRGVCVESHPLRNTVIALVILALIIVGIYYYIYVPAIQSKELTIRIYMKPLYLKDGESMNPYNATVYLDGVMIFHESWNEGNLRTTLNKTVVSNDFRIVLVNEYSYQKYVGGKLTRVNETKTDTYDFSIIGGHCIDIEFDEWGVQTATQYTEFPE